MTDLLGLFSALLVGLLLGGFFFIGLWWTVQKGLTAKRPAVLFLGSLLVRTGVTVLGFYAIAGDSYQRLLLCLLGFILARLMVTQWSKKYRQTDRTEDINHAPQS
jgi:F1F0 ATPase subunit 2